MDASKPSSIQSAVDKTVSGSHLELLQATLECVSEGIVVVDSNKQVRYWNKAAEDVFASASTSFANDPIVLQCVTLPANKVQAKESSQAVLVDRFEMKTSNAISDSDCNLCVEREFFGVEIGDENWLLVKVKKASHSVATDSENELLKLALTDHLSGLLNRRGFQLALEENLHRQLALAIIDVDFFKRINDSQGHEVGDQAIRWIAEKIKEQFPDAVCIGRLGGDEFGVVVSVEQTNSFDSISKTFEEFCSHISNSKIQWYAPGVNVSVGVAIGNKTGLAARPMLSAADKAMYESKRNGRNQSTSVSVRVGAT